MNCGQVMVDMAEIAGVPEKKKKGILNAGPDPDAEWTRRLRWGQDMSRVSCRAGGKASSLDSLPQYSSPADQSASTVCDS